MDEAQDEDFGPSDDLPPTAPPRDVKALLGSEVFDKYGPGIHYDMPAEDYFAIPAISQSSLKEATKSFMHFRDYIEGGERDETPAMEFGKLAHLCLLENKRFMEVCMFSKFADKRAAGYKKACKENPEKIVLTERMSYQLSGMFTSLSQNAGCLELVREGRAEVVILAIDPVTQLRLKCRIDLLSDKYALDYKTCEDAKPTVIPEKLDAEVSIRSSKFEKNAHDMAYENQGAFYLYMCELAGAPRKFFAIIAQEKKRPWVPCPYVLGFETLEEAADENRWMLNRIKDALMTAKFPGYSETPVVLARPSYARK